MKAQITVQGFFISNESKLRLTLPTGSIIEFKTAEKPDNLFGDDVYAAVFDEFTRSREEAWYALRSTLTKTNGKCKFIGNVKGKGNWGYRLAQRAKQGEQNFEYFKITAYQAAEEGLLKYEEIEQAKRDLPERVFNELYLAEASDDGTNPFGGTDRIRQQIRTISNKPAIAYGVDLAKSVDWTCIIGLDEDGCVCELKRFQSDWGQTRQTIIDTCKEKPVLIDSTGVGDSITEDLQRTMRNVEGFKFTQNSKQQIMEGLASAIHQNKIFYPDGQIVDELSNFEYEYTRLGVKYTAPQGLHDDTVCSLALALKKWSEQTRKGHYMIL